jgi:hypothetical protein
MISTQPRPASILVPEVRVLLVGVHVHPDLGPALRGARRHRWLWNGEIRNLILKRC